MDGRLEAIAADPKGCGTAEQSLAVPGVLGASARSTLLTSVSLPSEQREMLPLPAAVSTRPTPEPSVYGAPESPS